jgi:hypothetical protein
MRFLHRDHVEKANFSLLQACNFVANRMRHSSTGRPSFQIPHFVARSCDDSCCQEGVTCRFP